MRDDFIATMWVFFMVVNAWMFFIWGFKPRPFTPRQNNAMIIGFVALGGCWVCNWALP